MLENKFYDLALAFLHHKSVKVRQKILDIISSIADKPGSNFLNQRSVIEKLLRMIKYDEMRIKITILWILVSSTANDPTKMQFWI